MSIWFVFQDGKIEAEDFTSRLYRELNSSPQPYLVPFLKVIDSLCCSSVLQSGVGVTDSTWHGWDRAGFLAAEPPDSLQLQHTCVGPVLPEGGLASSISLGP